MFRFFFELLYINYYWVLRIVNCTCKANGSFIQANTVLQSLRLFLEKRNSHFTPEIMYGLKIRFVFPKKSKIFSGVAWEFGVVYDNLYALILMCVITLMTGYFRFINENPLLRAELLNTALFNRIILFKNFYIPNGYSHWKCCFNAFM